MLIRFLIFGLIIFANMCAEHSPKLLSVDRIWDLAPHNAFCDLIYFQDTWYCAFRESDRHQSGEEGRIRLIRSVDGEKWESSSEIRVKGLDLRDPKLSITPNGKLLLLIGSINSKNLHTQTGVMFSENGGDWSPFQKILEPNQWLWRLTWFEGKGYGVTYGIETPPTLYQTTNGVDYEKITEWYIPGYPSEATLRFFSNKKLVSIIRRRGDAWIGTSLPPYEKWDWKETKRHLGGPNFLIMPDGSMLAAGRISEDGKPKTALLKMTFDQLEPILTLPSSGDSSYPGMVLKDRILWICYYSSHEENQASIYLAKIQL